MPSCEQQENSIPLLLKIVSEVELYVWHFVRLDLELVVSHVHHPNVLHVVFLYEGVDKPCCVSRCKKRHWPVVVRCATTPCAESLNIRTTLIPYSFITWECYEADNNQRHRYNCNVTKQARHDAKRGHKIVSTFRVNHVARPIATVQRKSNTSAITTVRVVKRLFSRNEAQNFVNEQQDAIHEQPSEQDELYNNKTRFESYHKWRKTNHRHIL